MSAKMPRAPSLETLIKLILLALGIGLTFFMMGMRVYKGYEERMSAAYAEANEIGRIVGGMTFVSGAELEHFVDGAFAYWTVLPAGRAVEKEPEAFRVLRSKNGRTAMIALDGEKIRETLLEENKMMLVLALLTLFAAVQISAFVAYSVTRPLQRLAWGFRQLATGTGARLPKCRFAARELIHLTNAFNEMAEQLDHWREVQKKIVRMDRLASLGEMVSSVAHEIRNPLASMRIHLDLLRGTLTGDPKSCAKLDIFEEELGRLERKLNHFLNFARQGSNRREKIVPGDLLDWIAAMLASPAREKGVEVRVAVRGEENAACGILGDADELKQALLNLALNGVQAMEHGGVLSLTLEYADGAAAFVVEDTGCGVPEAIRDRLFEPFVTSRADGTGLGLAIARKCAEEHGGTLHFETSPTGSKFFMTLPLDCENGAREGFEA